MADMGRRCRVAVVDDDPAALALIFDVLSSRHIDVVQCLTFESGRTALRAAPPPDALVVDVRLGSHNGLQLVHLAKQTNPAMPVIAISGFDDPVVVADAAAAGASLLTKPIEFDELFRRLADAGVCR